MESWYFWQIKFLNPKQLASPSVFKECYDGGILINLWNPEIGKNLSTSYEIEIIYKKSYLFVIGPGKNKVHTPEPVGDKNFHRTVPGG